LSPQLPPNSSAARDCSEIVSSSRNLARTIPTELRKL
jgi:hypothetical protein